MSDPPAIPKSSSAQNDRPKTTARNKTPDTSADRAAFAQVRVALIAGFHLVGIGLLGVAMPRVAIAAHQGSPAEPLNMNIDLISRFGSVAICCRALGCLISGFWREKWGTKSVASWGDIMLGGVWLLLYFGDRIDSPYDVAAVTGFCTGLSEVPVFAYIGEIAEPGLRSTLSTILTAAIPTGILILSVFALLFDWATVLWLSVAFVFISSRLLHWIDESPTMLIRKDRLKDAKKSLCKLRGRTKPRHVDEEFQNLFNHVTSSYKQSSMQSNTVGPSTEGAASPKKDSFLKTQCIGLWSKNVMRPFLLIFCTFLLNFTTFHGGVQPFLTRGILRDNSGSPREGKPALVSAQIVFLFGAAMNVLLSPRFGKRKIALFSHGIATASILGIGISCSLLEGSTLYQELQWFPLILWLTIHSLSGLSILMLPYQLLCEVFPPKGRNLASGLTFATAHVVQHCVAIAISFIQESRIGLVGEMILFGSLAVVSFVHQYHFLPETEGKSLEQIETYFSENHDRKEKFQLKEAAKSSDT